MSRICENPVTGRKLALTENGDLCVYKDAQWQRLGFNERFAGEFPPCTFQDILYARDDFYAAGTTDDGQAVLYSSLTGELWTPVNLTEQHYWEGKGRLPKGGAVKLFLGIRDGRYIGGRLGNYTDTPEALTGAVCAALERIRAMMDKQAGTEPFRLIPALMKEADIGETKTQTRRNTP